jgi:hypothetical protein
MPAGNPRYPRRPWPKYGFYPAGDPRRTLIERQVGGALQKAPTVVTLGTGVVGETSAHVNGTVNPNGLDADWWITYGTSLPMPGPFSTPIADVGTGTIPVTVTGLITGLTVGVTYYAAVVAMNAAGTTVGQPTSFVPTPTTIIPSAATGTINPYGQPAVTVPHFQQPFMVTLQGAKVVEQDTLEEIRSNVITIVDCVVGQCPVLPNFGRPDLNFTLIPMDTTELVHAIHQLEPRANEDVLGAFAHDGATWNVTLTTSATSSETV